jgi:hypothetical protein
MTAHREGPDHGDRLERAYRRLLFAYPAYYRRRRGEEMLATLLDCAPAGRIRPTVREAVVLIGAGLRCRMHLRRGPATAVAAVLAAVIGVIVTGTAGAWLAWHVAAPPLPDPQQAAAIAWTAVPQEPSGQVRFPFLFGEEGADYSAGSVQFTYPGHPGPDASPLVVQARQRLEAAGWSIGALEFTPPPQFDGATVTTGLTSFVGHRGEVQIVVEDAGRTATVRLARAEPAAVPWCTVVGALLGGLIGWQLAAIVSRRLAHRPAGARAAVIVLSAVAFTTLLPSCLYALPPFIRGYLSEGQPEPPWGGLALPFLRDLVAFGAISALAVVVVALAAGSTGRDRPMVGHLDQTVRSTDGR